MKALRWLKCYVYAVDANKAWADFPAMCGGEKLLRRVVAGNVRRARLSRDLSQERLAHEAGLHRTFIGHVERAGSNISIDNIEKLAIALGVPAFELLMAEGQGR